MLESIKHLLHTLYDVQGLIRWGGILGVCVIVFIETGFFVGFFLPGDSLLVTAGVFAAAHLLDLKTLVSLSILCAIAGDQVGYWIGRGAGPALFKREDSLIFKRKHLDRAHAFYEKYGGKTVILARYVPIVRTFCPPVAGAAGMPYGRYFVYDVIGGILWAEY
jgi:membrane-associated protein